MEIRPVLCQPLPLLQRNRILLQGSERIRINPNNRASAPLRRITHMPHLKMHVKIAFCQEAVWTVPLRSLKLPVIPDIQSALKRLYLKFGVLIHIWRKQESGIIHRYIQG